MIKMIKRWAVENLMDPSETLLEKQSESYSLQAAEVV